MGYKLCATLSGTVAVIVKQDDIAIEHGKGNQGNVDDTAHATQSVRAHDGQVFFWIAPTAGNYNHILSNCKGLNAAKSERPVTPCPDCIC